MPCVRSTGAGHQRLQEKNRPLDSIMMEIFDIAQEEMQDPAGSGTVTFV